MPLPEEEREGDAEVELHPVPGLDREAVLDMEGEGEAVVVTEPEEVTELVWVNARYKRNIIEDSMRASKMSLLLDKPGAKKKGSALCAPFQKSTLSAQMLTKNHKQPTTNVCFTLLFILPSVWHTE